ncbi:hypothetical protein HPP92_025316 [Vanilla planifolia]|uniref:Uncharacterized protein n=1 Tax=Vanilla planifolia TaxID=51239 RepID=A0A835UA33_VANPL|nr:hypothetical protein HPP92_025316 [Vanilla planifolia]
MKGVRNYKGADFEGSLAVQNSKQQACTEVSPAPSSLCRLFSTKSLLCLFFFSILCIFYVFTFDVSSFSPCSSNEASSSSVEPDSLIHLSLNSSSPIASPPRSPPRQFRGHSPATDLQHIVFGIAASAKFWEKRKEYIKIWWRPRQMRGCVWLDKPVKEYSKNNSATAAGLPLIRISSDTSNFPYTHKQGSRSALRISRIVSETLRLGLDNIRWFVMGDDDTVFLPDNLVRVLNKYDHRQPYYIGSHSESHLQNIIFSYDMAYGGGGFAISRTLAIALSRMQDRCIHRYPALYGSDDRIQACMAELGVPLTRHPGFHQFDVYGDLLGLLAAHPVAPLVSLHHLDVVEPIFPYSRSRPAAIQLLFDGPVRLDSAGVMQQSICYHGKRQWTLSLSWGFVVQVVRGILSPREMEMPARTFLNWYRRADYTFYAFNTRPVARNPCQKPFLYYLASASYDSSRRTTITRYRLHKEPRQPICRWKMADPSSVIDEVAVYKKPDPFLWDRAPRRNCCRVLPASKAGKKTMVIEVGACLDGEIAEAH